MVALATFISGSLVFFAARHQDNVSGVSLFGIPLRERERDEFGIYIPQSFSGKGRGSHAAKKPSDTKQHPLSASPGKDGSKEQIPAAKPENPTNSNSQKVELTSSNELQSPPQPLQPPQAGFKPEFAFQNDLDLELPVTILKSFSNNKPHNYNPGGPKTNVYATFMATRSPSLKDPYYLAIHSLIHRLLWNPRSRTEKYAVIVYVADFVTPEQRQLLAGAGAIVRELAPLEWNPNVEGIQSRWKDLFAKLNMWKETEFSKIVFLDADAFPVANTDAMFDLAVEQNCIESKLTPDDHLVGGASACEPYVFAGIPHNPFSQDNIEVNGGVLVFSPSLKMHQRLLQNYLKYEKYDVKTVEQGFLNWQFNIKGAFPATALERQWGAVFPTDEDEGKVKVVHEKIWSEEKTWMKKEWVDRWIEMSHFYMSEEFGKMRFMDGAVGG